ncbi:MAG: sugar phosphate nucleotidyltransferase, partial [Nitrospirales bacterium]
MKAVILSAGQGKRLLPLTADQPKCNLSINGQSILEWQIQELLRFGIDVIHVVVGFGAEKVETLLANRIGTDSIRTLYNPFFSLTDNLISCWIARPAPALRHERFLGYRLRHEEDALEVDVEEFVPLRFGHLERRLWNVDPRVVDQDIDPPELLHHQVHARVDLG